MRNLFLLHHFISLTVIGWWFGQFHLYKRSTKLVADNHCGLWIRLVHHHVRLFVVGMQKAITFHTDTVDVVVAISHKVVSCRGGLPQLLFTAHPCIVNSFHTHFDILILWRIVIVSIGQCRHGCCIKAKEWIHGCFLVGREPFVSSGQYFIIHWGRRERGREDWSSGLYVEWWWG